MAAESEEGKEVSLEFSGEELSVPASLMEDEEIFSHVISRDTWDNILTESDRESLSKLLPQELSADQKESTISELFGGGAFKFGTNPVTDTWNKLSGGDYVKEISGLKEELKQLKYQLYQQSMKYYHMNLLQDILLSKRHLMHSALDNGSLDNLEFYDNSKLIKKRRKGGIWSKTESKYRKILDECCKEGDFEFSSDDEATPTERKPVFTEEEYQRLLRRHKKRRRMKKLDPDLNTCGITLASIAGGTSSSSSAAIKTEHHPPPPSPSNNIKHEKTPPPATPPSKVPPNPVSHTKTVQKPVVKDMKKWEGLFYGPGCVYEVYGEPEKLKVDKLSPIILDSPLPSSKFISFFSLVKKAFESLPDHKGDLYKVTEMVEMHLESPECQSCLWLPLQSDWSELTLSALCYLGGEVGSVSSFDPLPHFYPVIEFRDRIDHWRWIGNHRDSDVELLILCNHWYSNLNRALVVVDYTDYDPLLPLISTTATVKASKPHEVDRFQDLEQQRYLEPHKAFTYKVHGYEATVGPVKGAKTTVKKDNPKARGHALLKQERPNCVTILSLVRDACSRLPNGEGTRLDLCILLRDSQFVSDNVTNSQLNNAVSGALDRLHYEKDPCVRYISSKKIWLYLHRNRTEEEFEHISWAIEAASKNKKIIQTRAKQSLKILLRDSDGQLTDISPTPWTASDSKQSTTSLSAKQSLTSHRSPRSRHSGGAGGAGGGGGGGTRGGGTRGGRGSKSSRSRKTFTKAPAPVGGGASQSNIDSDAETELPFLPTTVHKDQDYDLHLEDDSDSTSDDIQLHKAGGVAFSSQPPPIPRLSEYDFHAPAGGGGGTWCTEDSESETD